MKRICDDNLKCQPGFDCNSFFADTCLILTPHYYGQIALSLGKQSLYIFSEFNAINTDTLLIRTLFMAPSVSVWKEVNLLAIATTKKVQRYWTKINSLFPHRVNLLLIQVGFKSLSYEMQEQRPAYDINSLFGRVLLSTLLALVN